LRGIEQGGEAFNEGVLQEGIGRGIVAAAKPIGRGLQFVGKEFQKPLLTSRAIRSEGLARATSKGEAAKLSEVQETVRPLKEDLSNLSNELRMARRERVAAERPMKASDLDVRQGRRAAEREYFPLSEEERVARAALDTANADLVVARRSGLKGKDLNPYLEAVRTAREDVILRKADRTPSEEADALSMAKYEAKTAGEIPEPVKLARAKEEDIVTRRVLAGDRLAKGPEYEALKKQGRTTREAKRELTRREAEVLKLDPSNLYNQATTLTKFFVPAAIRPAFRAVEKLGLEYPGYGIGKGLEGIGKYIERGRPEVLHRRYGATDSGRGPPPNKTGGIRPFDDGGGGGGGGPSPSPPDGGRPPGSPGGGISPAPVGPNSPYVSPDWIKSASNELEPRIPSFEPIAEGEAFSGGIELPERLPAAILPPRAKGVKQTMSPFEWADVQSPGRFTPPDKYTYQRETPRPGLEHEKEPFFIEGRKSKGEPYSKRAYYGQTPQMTAAELLEVAKKDPEWGMAQLREMAGQNPDLFTQKTGTTVEAASPEDLAAFIERYQPGGTGKIIDPEQTRAMNVKKGKLTILNTETKPFAKESAGWEGVSLKGLKRMESERQSPWYPGRPPRPLLEAPKEPLRPEDLPSTPPVEIEPSLPSASKGFVKPVKPLKFGKDVNFKATEPIDREAEAAVRKAILASGERPIKYVKGMKIEKGKVYEMRPEDFKENAGRFQFRENADEFGIERKLEGEWSPEGAGNLLLWRDKEGNVWTVDGHHRAKKFRDAKGAFANAQIMEESAGITEEMAKAQGAFYNIRDETAKVEDVARFFRNNKISKDAARKQGLLRGAKGETGFVVGRFASDEVYFSFINGQIGEKQAATIALAGKENPGLQDAGLKFVERRGKDIAPEKIAHFLAALKGNAIKKAGPKQLDIFGDIIKDDAAIKESEAMGDAAMALRARVLEKIRAAGGAVKNVDEAAVSGVQVPDVEFSKGKLGELKRQYYDLHEDRWIVNSALVNEIRKLAGLNAL
jgi:hypothetical protein